MTLTVIKLSQDILLYVNMCPGFQKVQFEDNDVITEVHKRTVTMISVAIFIAANNGSRCQYHTVNK